MTQAQIRINNVDEDENRIFDEDLTEKLTIYLI